MSVYSMLIGTLVVGLVAIALVAVIFGTIRKNKLGINLNAISCPQCGRSLPSKRLPTSLRQMLWGGWTCGNCGVELDKWGHQLGNKGVEVSSENSEVDAPSQHLVGTGDKKKTSPAFWLLVLLVVLVSVAYDYVYPSAIKFDVVGIAALVIWFYKRQR